MATCLKSLPLCAEEQLWFIVMQVFFSQTERTPTKMQSTFPHTMYLVASFITSLALCLQICTPLIMATCLSRFDLPMQVTCHAQALRRHLQKSVMRSVTGVQTSAQAHPSTKELFLIIPMHMMKREIFLGRKKGFNDVPYKLWQLLMPWSAASRY